MKALVIAPWLKTAKFSRFVDDDAINNQDKQRSRDFPLSSLSRCILIVPQDRNH